MLTKLFAAIAVLVVLAGTAVVTLALRAGGSDDRAAG